MSSTEAIRSMAILEPFDGKENDMLVLLREFYGVMYDKGYSRDLLYRDAQHAGRYIHLRIWNSDDARTQAVNDPDVHRFWIKLAEICAINTTYEQLEPVYNSYDSLP
jgi:hypothetical protein